MVYSIRTLGQRLVDRVEEGSGRDQLRERIDNVLDRWDNVCKEATTTQYRLQKLLLEVSLESVYNWLTDHWLH